MGDQAGRYVRVSKPVPHGGPQLFWKMYALHLITAPSQNKYTLHDLDIMEQKLYPWASSRQAVSVTITCNAAIIIGGGFARQARYDMLNDADICVRVFPCIYLSCMRGCSAINDPGTSCMGAPAVLSEQSEPHRPH